MWQKLDSVTPDEIFCPKSELFWKSLFFDFFSNFWIFVENFDFHEFSNWAAETSFGRMESFLSLFDASSANLTDCKKKIFFFIFSLLCGDFNCTIFSNHQKHYIFLLVEMVQLKSPQRRLKMKKNIFFLVSGWIGPKCVE